MRSLNSVTATELTALLERNDIDIALLQETWHHSAQLPGYRSITNFRNNNFRGGGTAILFRRNITLKLHSLLQSSSPGEPEAILATTESTLIVNLYLPPKCLQSETHRETLQQAMLNAPNRPEVIIAGDVNLDPSAQTNKEVEYLLDILSAFNVEPRLRTSTRQNRCIDNFFTSVEPVRIKMFQFNNSDHSCLAMEFERPLPTKYITKVNSRKINIPEYLTALEPIIRSARTFDEFHTKVTQLVQKISPHITVTNSSNRSQRIAFFDDELKALFETRNRQLRVYQRDPTPENRSIYKTLRNNVKAVVRKKRREYFKDRFRDPNDVNLFKSFHALTSSKTHAKCKLDENKIEELNEYFSKIGAATNANLSAELTQPEFAFPFRFRNITVDDLRSAAMELPFGSAVGEDHATATIVRETVEKYARDLLSLINDALEAGVFPDSLKSACVTLIPKTNPPSTEAANYRPISLLSLWSKLIEKCVKRQLASFAEDHLGRFQYGFRRFLHCEAALLNVSDTILQALDERDQAVLLMLDLSCF